jgi:hypothetical protein
MAGAQFAMSAPPSIGQVPRHYWFNFSLLGALALAVVELILLFNKDVLDSISGKPHPRGRRASILGAVGCLGPTLLAGVIFVGTIFVLPLLPGKWKQGSFLEAPAHFSQFDHVGGTATLLRDGRVLLAGWQAPRGGMTAEFYSPEAKAFTRAPDMPNARAFNPVAILLKNGRVLVAGGDTPSHGRVEAIDIFDPVANRWMTTGKLPPETRLADGVALEDGGVLFTTEEGGTEALLRFDPLMGSLGSVGHPSMVVNGTPLATLLQNGKVLVTHLEYGGPNSPCPNAFLFDPVSRTTTPLPRMAQNRAQHQATLLKDGRVLITGGAEGAPSAELFDPKKGTFEPAGEMLVPRALHRAVALSDGRVLIFGGVPSKMSESMPASTPLLGNTPKEIEKILSARPRPMPRTLEMGCEIFDPGTNRFSECPPPPFLSNGGMGPRNGVHILLPDGRVLLLALEGPITFDPVHLTWNPLQPAPQGGPERIP